MRKSLWNELKTEPLLFSYISLAHNSLKSLKIVREECLLSQENLAQEIEQKTGMKVSPEAISKYERGLNNKEALHRVIAETLNVNPNEYINPAKIINLKYLRNRKIKKASSLKINIKEMLSLESIPKPYNLFDFINFTDEIRSNSCDMTRHAEYIKEVFKKNRIEVKKLYSNLIRKKIKLSGMSNSEVASLSHLSIRTIQKICKGDYANEKSVKRIEKALGMQPEYFLKKVYQQLCMIDEGYQRKGNIPK